MRSVPLFFFNSISKKTSYSNTFKYHAFCKLFEMCGVFLELAKSLDVLKIWFQTYDEITTLKKKIMIPDFLNSLLQRRS